MPPIIPEIILNIAYYYTPYMSIPPIPMLAGYAGAICAG